MRVAGIQHDIVWEQRDANFAHLAPMIEHAAKGGARLVVLTEMFSTGFSMASDRIAEDERGPSTKFLQQQAARAGIWLCGSIPVRAEGRARPANRLVLAGPDGSTHFYDKIHPFTYSGEHERYEAGDAFLTVDIEGVRVSFFVCYDLRFADEFWGLAPTTDCYVVVANWPEVRRNHWRTLLRARADREPGVRRRREPRGRRQGHCVLRRLDDRRSARGDPGVGGSNRDVSSRRRSNARSSKRCEPSSRSCPTVATAR